MSLWTPTWTRDAASTNNPRRGAGLQEEAPSRPLSSRLAMAYRRTQTGCDGADERLRLVHPGEVAGIVEDHGAGRCGNVAATRWHRCHSGQAVALATDDQHRCLAPLQAGEQASGRRRPRPPAPKPSIGALAALVVRAGRVLLGALVPAPVEERPGAPAPAWPAAMAARPRARLVRPPRPRRTRARQSELRGWRRRRRGSRPAAASARCDQDQPPDAVGVPSWPRPARRAPGGVRRARRACPARGARAAPRRQSASRSKRSVAGSAGTSLCPVARGSSSTSVRALDRPPRSSR